MKTFYYEIGSTSDVQVVEELFQALHQQLELDLSSEISDIYGDRSNTTSNSTDPSSTVDLNQNVSKAVSRSCYKNVFQELDEMWTASDAIPRFVDSSNRGFPSFKSNLHRPARISAESAYKIAKTGLQLVENVHLFVQRSDQLVVELTDFYNAQCKLQQQRQQVCFVCYMNAASLQDVMNIA